MSKDFAWELFKNTGNVDAFMIMKEYETSEDMAKIKGEKDGNNKDKGNCN